MPKKGQSYEHRSVSHQQTGSDQTLFQRNAAFLYFNSHSFANFTFQSPLLIQTLLRKEIRKLADGWFRRHSKA